MKTGISYSGKTGNTEQIARRIADALASVRTVKNIPHATAWEPEEANFEQTDSLAKGIRTCWAGAEG